MEDLTKAKEVRLTDRIADLREKAKQSRNTAGFLLGLGAVAAGSEALALTTYNGSTALLVATVGVGIATGVGVGTGVSEALECIQMGNEIAALETVQAQQASQPGTPTPEVGS